MMFRSAEKLVEEEHGTTNVQQDRSRKKKNRLTIASCTILVVSNH